MNYVTCDNMEIDTSAQNVNTLVLITTYYVSL